MGRYQILRAILATFVAALVAACGGGGSDTETGGGGGGVGLERRIVVVGDSIGNGYGASVAYPDLLAGLTGIPVVNISKDGTNAETGVSRIPDLIEQYRPMYMVFLLGSNNATGSGGGVSGAVNSLEYAANATSAAGVIGIIGTLPPIKRSSSENSAASAISSGIRGISNARIADINASLNGADIGSDGKHPNNSGQQKIANLFAAEIY
jgi:lysophospholipase L1-like esterase